jgi:hypothetical protein
MGRWESWGRPPMMMMMMMMMMMTINGEDTVRKAVDGDGILDGQGTGVRLNLGGDEIRR